jgi:hypothetical protein
MSQTVVEEAQRYLLRAANAWRRRRGQGEIPEHSAEAAVGMQASAAFPPAHGPVILTVQPRRTGRPDAQIESETIALLQSNVDVILRRYDQAFGRILNADNMSELLDVHGDGERWAHHDAVRSSASAATQAGFDRALAVPVTLGEDVVLFTGGGTGSGKSTAVGPLPQRRLALDSTLSRIEPSQRNIDRALASGRSVIVLFVYRDPLDAFINGVVARALDPTNGRVVPIRIHAQTHVGVTTTLAALSRLYADDPRVAFLVLENVTGGASHERDVDWLQETSARVPAVDVLKAELERALAAETASGRVSAPLAERLAGHA